ncbi:MAG: hypothetical protein PHD21_05955 [Flavobacteriales bacterium]|nr:hypothetical protein [Flavobacteriales bacterium]
MKKETKKTLTHYYTLPCGVKVLHRVTGGKISHLAYMFNIGSRDEQPSEHGMRTI